MPNQNTLFQKLSLFLRKKMVVTTAVLTILLGLSFWCGYNYFNQIGYDKVALATAPTSGYGCGGYGNGVYDIGSCSFTINDMSSITCSVTSPFTDNRTIIPQDSVSGVSTCIGNLDGGNLTDYNLKLRIGNANSDNHNNSSPQTCTMPTATTFKCDNVPTGSLTGGQPILAKVWATVGETDPGDNLTNTLYKTNVYSSKAYANSKLSFILTGNQAPVYTNIKQVGSTDTVGVKLSDLNLYTNLDLGNTSKKYACFFYAKQLSDTNWRPLNYDDSIASVNKNKGVLYNPTGNVGCSANFTRSNVTREYPGTNSDGSGNTDGTTVKSDPITAFGWEFRIDVRESTDGQTPTITNTLIHSNKGNLNLLFIGALGS